MPVFLLQNSSTDEYHSTPPSTSSTLKPTDSPGAWERSLAPSPQGNNYFSKSSFNLSLPTENSEYQAAGTNHLLRDKFKGRNEDQPISKQVWMQNVEKEATTSTYSDPYSVSTEGSL